MRIMPRIELAAARAGGAESYCRCREKPKMHNARVLKFKATSASGGMKYKAPPLGIGEAKKGDKRMLHYHES